MTSVLQPGIAEITNQLEYDDEVAFLAIRKLYDYARYDADRRFCLMVSFTHPHDPYAARERFWNLYRDSEIDDAGGCRSCSRQARSAQPAASTRYRPWTSYRVTDADIRAARHGYFANISYVDDLIGSCSRRLRSTGRIDDTVIVFTSDHGDFLGERGLWYKMSFLEPSARVPLIDLGAGPLRAAPGARSRLRLPTFCRPFTISRPMAAATLARPVDGRSLHGLLNGASRRPGCDRVGRISGRRRPGADVHAAARHHGNSSTPRPIPISCSIWRQTPMSCDNLAASPAAPGPGAVVAPRSRRQVRHRADHREVLQSQQARLMMFEALKRGHRFPWDFQPLRDASEQYTRNHMSVTGRDLASRFPKAPAIDEKPR